MKWLATFFALLFFFFFAPIWLVMFLILQNGRLSLAFAVTIVLLRMWQMSWMRDRH